MLVSNEVNTVMDPIQPTDQQLVQTYLEGEKGAFDALMLRYMTPVHTLAFHYAKNRQDAEDITQEAFIKAMRHLRRFDTQKPFKPWILQIVKNQALDHLKRKKMATFSALENEDENILDAIPDPAPLPDAITLGKEMAAGVRAAISHLSPIEQRILFFRYIKELSFKEIAQELHDVLDTVKSRHRRSLLKLRKIIAKSQNAPELS